MDLDALTSGGVIPLSWILNNDHEVIMKFRERFSDQEWHLFTIGYCTYQYSLTSRDAVTCRKSPRRVGYRYCQQHPGSGNIYVPHQISGLTQEEQRVIR